MRLFTIRNISRFPIGILVDPIPEVTAEPTSSDITNVTDVTSIDITSTPFPASGLITLYPGKKMTVEEDRLNLGQIDNLKKENRIRILVF